MSDPMTNREAHEKDAGMGLCDEFFTASGIDPDASCESSAEVTNKPDYGSWGRLSLIRRIKELESEVEILKRRLA